MNLDIDNSIDINKLEEDIENMLFCQEYTIRQVCDEVCMTEDELRSIPVINDLLNK